MAQASPPPCAIRLPKWPRRYLVLKSVLSEQEMQDHIDPVYQKFMRREVDVPGG